VALMTGQHGFRNGFLGMQDPAFKPAPVLPGSSLQCRNRKRAQVQYSRPAKRVERERPRPNEGKLPKRRLLTRWGTGLGACVAWTCNRGFEELIRYKGRTYLLWK
jgi:hypothetical protein